MITTPWRRLLALLLSLTAGLLTVLVTASPAAATAFRYWSYWQGASGTWVAAQTGPGDHVVTDRDVQGWRFAISTAEVSAFPDNAPDFAALCPEQAAAAATAGQVRVAVVIDAGFVADAPEGQSPPGDTVACVSVPEGSTGSQALAAAATSVDEQGGLVCAVNGYPTGECVAEVSDADAAAAAAAAADEAPNPADVAAPAAPAQTDDQGSPTAFALGALALAALLVAAWLLTRSRRQRQAAEAAVTPTDQAADRDGTPR